MTLRLSLAALFAAAFALLAGPALARCSKNLVELGPTLQGRGVQMASLDGAQMAADTASRAIITFLGHASFEIDTPQGVRAITDYNGLNGFGRKPDIVTMNNAHSTHYTDTPEDGITYVLRGWPSEAGQTEARHDVSLKDLKVANLPTNARDWGGGSEMNLSKVPGRNGVPAVADSRSARSAASSGSATCRRCCVATDGR